MGHRLHRALVASALCLAASGCAVAARSADAVRTEPGRLVPPVVVGNGPTAGLVTPIATTLSIPAPASPASHVPAEDRAARDHLAAAMRRDLGGVLLPDNLVLTRAALAAGQAMMVRQHVAVESRQTILLVDRSPAVQRLWIVAAFPGHPWEPLGSVHVSTGKPGRKEHFRTPVGVFVNDTGILGYRALGTYNENHIRGNGTKGMRVWDFGWQTTDDWRTKGAPMAIRMEMHATDPANLELRLGHWDSEGCIRIPSRFNTFADEQGLIDAKLREAAATDRRFAALLPKTVPSPMAGSVVVVVDSTDRAAEPSDPVRANALEHRALPPDDAG